MKENLTNPNSGAVTGRLTRARAAALRSRSSSSQDSDAAASDKKNQNVVADPRGLQRKRKAVLQDVTNVLCESYYKDCFNATKSLAKNAKKGSRAPLIAPKAVKPVPVEILKPQGVPKAENGKASRKEPRSGKVPQVIKKDQNVSSQLSAADDVLLGRVSRGTALQEGQSLSKMVEKGRADEGLTILSNPEITNIDADTRNPLLCSIYAPDIYDNQRIQELLGRPKSDFMETVQRDITKGMRGILIDWLVEVSAEYSLTSDTLYSTVHLIDGYLSQNFIEQRSLQLLGITCMLIASKYEEICAPRVDELCFMTDNTYTREEVLRMEGELLRFFGFRISAPTTKTFLRRFLLAAQATHESPTLELEYLADYLAELTLLECDFLNFLPSLIAASSVFLAKWTLDSSRHPWNPTLEYYTRYKVSDLKTTVFALRDLQLNMEGCPLNAIRTKYRQQKFKSVASLPSSKLLETLF